MTYSSMANFQGEGSLDTAPKKEQIQVASISNDYSNYSYTPPEEELYEIAPEKSKNYESTINFKPTAENLKKILESNTLGYKGYGTSPEGEFGGTGLGAKPTTTEPVINTDDDKPTSYLDSVKTNLLNAASGSVKRVKDFLGGDTTEPDDDYNVVYDEYDTLYMPPELKAKNVPMGPKGVLTNYVPYVTTYSVGGTDPVIPQESLVDLRGEFPYTDDYRERIDNILNDDEIKRKSSELGISSQKALDLYFDSLVPPAIQEYINLNLGASLRPYEPAFESYEVADSTGGFDSLMGLDSWMKSTEQGLEGAFSGEPMFKYTSPVKDEVILKKDIDVTEFNYQTSRKATLTDLKNGIKGLLDARKFKSPTSSRSPKDSSTQVDPRVEGLGPFLLDVDPKVRLGGVGINVDTSLGNFGASSDWDGGDVNFEYKWDKGTVNINTDGTGSFEFNMKF